MLKKLNGILKDSDIVRGLVINYNCPKCNKPVIRQTRYTNIVTCMNCDYIEYIDSINIGVKDLEVYKPENKYIKTYELFI